MVLDGNKFIVEMQVAHEKGFEHRAQYYAAKTYIEQRIRVPIFTILRKLLFWRLRNLRFFRIKKVICPSPNARC